jgi:hypothetical protein
VLAAETPRQRRWAVSTAIEIVRKLAKQHPKVVLADLQMRAPSALAAALGIDEGPGIVDVLYRDAAFSAVARKPDSETFYFLAVGSSSPPINVLYQHPRWKKIAARLPDNDARLLPCVSAQDWLEAGPIPGFESCIVLNAAGLEVELPAEARSPDRWNCRGTRHPTTRSRYRAWSRGRSATRGREWRRVQVRRLDP